MLGSLLFGEYRQRTLGLLLLHPEASYHVRELARLTGTSPGTLHKELTKLTTGGILQRKQIGNQVHYSANLSCPIFDELASILRKTSGLADVLAKALIGLENKIEFAFVFGSVARGDQQTNSDVDIMLIGSLSFSDAVQALHTTQTVLQREINPVVYSQEEFNRRVKNSDSFIKEVLAKPKLFIIGKENELSQST
ncbi:MAG: nucleotidyltransferase domain-containing protein [Methylotenera sp.]